MASETFTFFWSNVDLDTNHPDGLTLDVATADQYALRKQVEQFGVPGEVEKVRGPERTLFRLTWHYPENVAGETLVATETTERVEP